MVTVRTVISPGILSKRNAVDAQRSPSIALKTSRDRPNGVFRIRSIRTPS